MTMQPSLNEMAIQHYMAGRMSEAQMIYKKILAEEPSHAGALRMLGLVTFYLGNHVEALDLVRRAIQSDPNSAEYPLNLGQMLDSLGRHEEAIVAYRQALENKPDFAEANYYLACALRSTGQADQAIVAFRQALQYRPEYAEANNDLGNLLLKMDQLDEAIVVLRKAATLRPDYMDAWINLGNALHATGQLDEALKAFRTALATHPAHAGSHWNLGLTYLMNGDYLHGWTEYEWRFRAGIVADPGCDQPRWNGENLHGKRILIHAEQGIGDTLQFCRYAPMLAGRGGKIIFRTPRALFRLMHGLAGVDELVAVDEPLPPFDIQCPLASLPGILKTTVTNIPNHVPYLRCDPARVDFWRKRIPADRRLKVGIVWGGRSIPYPTRSMPLTQLASLAYVPGTWFYSLQKGEAAGEIRNAPPGLIPNDWTNELVDFAETAALIENLDLIVAVDTSVAHLAGALGKPVWLMLKYAPDWRWMLGRTGSPWYPTMRLFRQTCPGDWTTPASELTEAMKSLVEQR